MVSLPTCVVCNTSFKYKGPKPHLLPCLHAVCSGCLGADINSTITCSVCQRSHDRINQSFPVDHVVLAEVLDLTAQHRPSEISCTNKEDGNQAVCWCEECSEFFCEHCQISHGEVKTTRGHKIWEMSDLSKTFKRSHSKCMRHGLPENVFDKNCGNFICCQCLFIEHNNHAAITSEESTSLDDNNLKKYVKSVSEKKEEVLQSTTTVDTHTNFLEDTSSCLRESVKHTFSELRSLLDQREKVILLELDQLMECMNTTNNSRRPVLKGMETSCQATLDYINKCLLYTPPQHLHQLKSSIEEATQFCKTSDVPQVHKQEASVTFFKQGLQDLRTAVSSFGSFLAPVDLTGQPDEFSSFQSVKNMLLEATIENLRTQTIVASQEMKTLTEEVSKRRDQIKELEIERNTLTEAVSKKGNEIQEHKRTKKTLTEEVTKRGDHIRELEKTNRHLQKVVQQVDRNGLTKDSFLYMINSGHNQVSVVKCPKMTLDNKRVNHHRVHLDETGALVYSPLKSTSEHADHLRKYCGTSAASPLPSSGLVYWEVEADVDIVGKVKDNILVLEIAVCEEDVMDESHYLGGQQSSCSLHLVQQDAHGSISLLIHENGKRVDTRINFLPNVSGTVRRLKFGVLYDGGTHEIAFIDVTDLKILGRGTVSVKKKPTKLWLMFATFEYTKMSLVSGVDITMSGKKENIISEAMRH